MRVYCDIPSYNLKDVPEMAKTFQKNFDLMQKNTETINDKNAHSSVKCVFCLFCLF